MGLIHWLQSWWSWWFVPKLIVFLIPLVISLISLGIVLHDRRPRIILRAKKGKWCTLTATAKRGLIVFEGIIEVYNVSSRANAIREYTFYWKSKDGLKLLESEQYEIDKGSLAPKEIHNRTPVTLAPYSGSDVRVQALAQVIERPYDMTVRIVVEDLFGNHSTLEVTADYK
jgi:hypothetical protein